MNKRRKISLNIIIVTAVFIYFAYMFFNQQILLNAKHTEMQGIQQKIDDEKKLNTDLKKQKEMANSDEYIEKIAREKLGMVKPGEKIFIDVNK